MNGLQEQGSRGAREQGRSGSLSWLLELIWQPGTLALLMIAAFAIFFSLLAVQQHRAFLTNGLDLGNVDQALWNTAQGRFLHFTLMAPVESRLALHVEPVLLLFVPFYWLGLGGPKLLLVAQAVIVALGAWPVYQLALGNEPFTRGDSSVVTYPLKRYPLAAVIFPLVYLLLPTLEAAVLFDFHAVTLAATFLLFAFWALEQKRDGLFIGFALLAMACKEDMPLVVMMLGLYAGLAQRRWRLAGSILSLSLTWFIIAFFVIQPRFAPGGNIQLDRYAWLGDEPLEMIGTLIGRPDLVFNHLLSRVDLLNYLGMLFFPTAFLALFSPLTLLPMLPPLAINLLSENPFTWRLEDFHYGAPLAPFLLISTIYGIRRVNNWITAADGVEALAGLPPKGSTPSALDATIGSIADYHKTANKEQSIESSHLPTSLSPHLISLLTLLLLTFSLIYHYHRGFTPLARSFQWPQITAHHHRLETVLATIPAGAAVFAQSNLAPHLSQRATLYGDFAYFTDPAFRDEAETVEHILLDVTSLENRGGLHPFLRQTLLESGNYQVLEAGDGILHLQPARPSLRLAASATALPASFYTFTRPDAPLDYAAQVDFGQVVRLQGYSLHFNRQEEAQVTVDLELLQPATNLRPVLYLLDAQGQPLGATVDLPPALAWLPVERWPVGEPVRVRFNTLPWYTRQTPVYRLALGLITGEDLWNGALRQRPQINRSAGFAFRFPADGSLLELALIEQRWSMPAGGPQLRRFNRLPVPNPLQANFDNQLRLLGYTIPPYPILPTPDPQSPITNPQLPITLYWQAITSPEPLTRFVQLVGPDGQLYGQQDSAPDGGLYPTGQWQPGEVVVETVILPVKTERPADRYTIHVGLYRPATGERLGLLAGGDHVEMSLSR